MHWFRFQSVDLTTIIHQRREKNEQLKQTTGILKQSLDVKLKSFDSFTEQLFEELRLELVSDLVKCYEIVTKEAYEENGKPPKRPKLDGGLADGNFILTKCIYERGTIVLSLFYI